MVTGLLQDFGIGYYKENGMKTTAGSSGPNFWAFGDFATLSRFLHLTTRRLRAKQKDTPQSGRDPLQDLRVLDSRQGQEQEETTRLFCRFETLGKNENNDKYDSSTFCFLARMGSRTNVLVVAPASVVLNNKYWLKPLAVPQASVEESWLDPLQDCVIWQEWD